MIEVNRRLYIDEKTGAKLPGFKSAKERIQAILKEIVAFGTE